MHAAFPSPVFPPGLPCTEATPMTAQEPGLSSPSPHRSMLSLVFLLTGPDTVRALPLSQMPLPFLDRATLPLKDPGVAFDSTTLMVWTTRTGAIPSPHAEPQLIIYHDGPSKVFAREGTHRLNGLMMFFRFQVSRRTSTHSSGEGSLDPTN